jgi:glycosyltransferase involved in cell wall biosynthesis
MIKKIINNLGYYGKRAMEYYDFFNFLPKSKNFYKEKIAYYKNFINILKTKDDYTTNLIYEKTKTNDILISVVTPVYNGRDFINELALCIQNQTIADKLEWLIVDDNSTDNSLDLIVDIAKDLKIGAIKVFKNMQNYGLAYSRDFLLKNSEANIITSIDVDDLYLSNSKLEDDLDLLLKENKDVIYPEFFYIGTNISNKRKMNLLYSPVFKQFLRDNFNFEDIYHRVINLGSILFLFNFTTTQFLFCKKDVYNRVGGLDLFLHNYTEDYDLIFKFILSGANIGFSKNPVFYRIHRKQLTNKKYLLFMFHSLVLTKFFKYVEFLRTDAIEKYFINFNLIIKLFAKKIYLLDYIKNLWLIFQLRRSIFFLFYLLDKYEFLRNEKVFLDIYKFYLKYIGKEILNDFLYLVMEYENTSSFYKFKKESSNFLLNLKIG